MLFSTNFQPRAEINIAIGGREEVEALRGVVGQEI